jgi:hypothetical protein
LDSEKGKMLDVDFVMSRGGKLGMPLLRMIGNNFDINTGRRALV